MLLSSLDPLEFSGDGPLYLLGLQNSGFDW